MIMEYKHEDGFAHEFYSSWEWIQCRRAYAKSKGGLCERCLARGLYVPGEECHHKERLTEENLRDPRVALNWENLELLCKACHKEEHARRATQDRRWSAFTDAAGNVNL